MENVDKRKHTRVLVLKTGAIHRGHGEAPIDCAVLNLSASGACILVPNAIPVPPHFELVVDGDGQSHHCEVMWREGGKIGVEFVPAAPRDDP